MIIGRDEKAKLWEKNGGRCSCCDKAMNPFSEAVFHAYDGRHIEMYCQSCEEIINSETTWANVSRSGGEKVLKTKVII